MAHSPAAAVDATSVAVTPLASRPTTVPATVSSSPSSTGSTNLTAAVPRSSQAAPNAATSGWVR
ncbi:MAG: hypothetical protein AUG87_06290 [Candidatus Rokubacteria bacterium 13_1_20CM_4_70_14]|nr:MAG: hypothetical protein AUG87_06290 [Candidatus Rokubacteria bacterium 13_1_20CM_4_70_14]